MTASSRETALSPSSPPSPLPGAGLLRLTLGCCLVFMAFQPLQALQSSLNDAGGVGTASLAVVYASTTAAAFVAPGLVRALGGERNGLALGALAYATYIASNFAPTFVVMVPASFALGIGASLLWVSQGSMLTSLAVAEKRARRGVGAEMTPGTMPRDESEGEGRDGNGINAAVSGPTTRTVAGVVAKFNAIFWSSFQLASVAGNALVAVVLSRGHPFDGTLHTDPSHGVVRAMLLVFLAFTLAGVGLLATLPAGPLPHFSLSGTDEDEVERVDREVDHEDGEADGMPPRETTPERSGDGCDGECKDARDWVALALQCPMFFYSGVQLSYATSDFTGKVVAPSLGKAMIGGVMVCFGVTNAATSALSGTIGLGSLSSSSGGAVWAATAWFASAAAAQGAAMVVVLGGDWEGAAAAEAAPSVADRATCFGLACLLGFGDGAMNTQISSLIGTGGLCVWPRRTFHPTVGFASWKMLQGIASAVTFACGPYLGIHLKTRAVLVALALAIVAHGAAVIRRDGGGMRQQSRWREDDDNGVAAYHRL